VAPTVVAAGDLKESCGELQFRIVGEEKCRKEVGLVRVAATAVVVEDLDFVVVAADVLVELHLFAPRVPAVVAMGRPEAKTQKPGCYCWKSPSNLKHELTTRFV